MNELESAIKITMFLAKVAEAINAGSGPAEAVSAVMSAKVAIDQTYRAGEMDLAEHNLIVGKLFEMLAEVSVQINNAGASLAEAVRERADADAILARWGEIMQAHEQSGGSESESESDDGANGHVHDCENCGFFDMCDAPEKRAYLASEKGKARDSVKLTKNMIVIAKDGSDIPQ